MACLQDDLQAFLGYWNIEALDAGIVFILGPIVAGFSIWALRKAFSEA